VRVLACRLGSHLPDDDAKKIVFKILFRKDILKKYENTVSDTRHTISCDRYSLNFGPLLDSSYVFGTKFCHAVNVI
jgi:hypothetical protein